MYIYVCVCVYIYIYVCITCMNIYAIYACIFIMNSYIYVKLPRNTKVGLPHPGSKDCQGTFFAVFANK